MNYFVLMTKAPGAGVIEMYPPKSPAGWKFDEGESLIKQYPKKAVVQFSSNFPEDRALSDFQENILSAFIISEKVRGVLESLKITNAEYLPVSILDHKGQVVGKNYAFLNLLGGEEALDMEKGVYRMNSLDEGQVGRVKKLVINKKGIRPGMKMFRCSRFRRLVLIDEEVHEAFVDAKLTGFSAVKAEGWNGLGF
jgi:hypothetical protein